MDDDQQDQMILKIPTARQKQLPKFPIDPRGDIKLIFKSKQFCLSKAYLRLQSGYFKKVCSSTVTNHQIKQSFNEDAFYSIMSCFYGASIPMKRNELNLYYPIIRFLQIQCLITQVREDILNFIQHHDIFVIMKIAHTNSDQELFQACLQQLQKQEFQQLKYHRFQLLETELSLFKLIIKAHNQHRSHGKPGIQFTQINQILSDYCQGKNMGKDAYRALKFELIDKTVLTSNQYKQIFMDEVIELKNKSQSQVNDYPTNQSIIVNGNPTGMMKLSTVNLASSVIASSGLNNQSIQSNPQNRSGGSLGLSSINNQYTRTYPQINSANNELALQMENTFQKKKNQQLINENKKLQQSIDNIQKQIKKNQQSHQQMEKQLKMLHQQLRKKCQQQQENVKKLQKFPKYISKMKKLLQKRQQDMRTLQKQIQQLNSKIPQNQQTQQQSSIFAQSQFLPAHFIGQLMSQNNKSKSTPIQISKQDKKSSDASNYQNMDQKQLQKIYSSKIKFDIEPVSTPKSNLAKLCHFITQLDFTIHTLSLVYRRSSTASPKGKNTDIRQKNSLLILINTVTGQNIGGFVSVPIPKNDVDYIEDNGAFLFTLTKNQKFNVKKSQAAEAIFMSEQYLISFANDLMISKQCLKEKSQCSWPSSYQGIKGIKQRGPVWLVSEAQFLIKDIQVYEMNVEEIEMVI